MPQIRNFDHGHIFENAKKILFDTQTQNSHLLPIILDGRHGVERPVVQDVLDLVENRVLREKDLGHLFDLETLRGQTVTVGIVSSNTVQIRLTEDSPPGGLSLSQLSNPSHAFVILRALECIIAA